jgi:hypothetical protein
MAYLHVYSIKAVTNTKPDHTLPAVAYVQHYEIVEIALTLALTVRAIACICSRSQK